MSKYRVPLTCLMLTAATLAGAAPSLAQTACGDRTKFIDTLDKKYDEKPNAFGIAGQKNLVELFVSKAGTWTMLLTSPRGTSCIIATGQSWEQFPASIAKMTAL
jgi:hypothetical protein